MRNPLKIRCYRPLVAAGLAFVVLLAAVRLIAAEPEYLQSFDPTKGFKPAQTDLTEIFLQLAGSLEYYGSPEPYLRHVAAEHARIESLYRKKSGKQPKSFRPDGMSDAYIDRVAGNWKHLAPSLGLEPFTKEFGHMMRDSIKGARGTGTIIVRIFNDHQTNVFDHMAGKGNGASNFDSLKADLVRELELDKSTVSEGGYETAQRDAVRCATILRGNVIDLFAKLDRALAPADAEKVKKILNGVIMDVGEMAHSELQAGISEWSIGKASTAAK